ncbi:serine/threonine-protein kinase UCNL [Eucalyptus grandis]|uniref:serine/threonine-protein kinase UCNL n=1 Tax=Eucalyptus grandis TaxID=71139 RepID=UPI00192ED5F5|nr:serine/threonine-protein kinase UCNL [Eucalyptus grandis]
MVIPPSMPPPSAAELHLDNLRALKVLGKGAMGTVLLVHDAASDPSASSPFALKLVDKSSAHDATRRARWEISVLGRLTRPSDHPFLPRLLASFETDEFLAWAVPYCPGGDLNVLRHHQNDRVFSPAVIRFYVAEIICALDHLHRCGIAYRDLKPENVLIQQSGHVTLTDFDLSKQLKPRKAKSIHILERREKEAELPQSKPKRNNLTRFVGVFSESKALSLKKAKSARVSPVSRRNKPGGGGGGGSFSDDGERSNSFVGTEEYVAPEVVRGEGHEFAVDWWALGVLTYEMLYGATPFRGKNRKETFRNVLAKNPEFIGKRTALTDLIERLLAKDPTMRLGYLRGAAEIKEHEFFRGLRWDLLTEVVLRPPFIPSRDDGGGADDAERLAARAVDVREYFRRSSQPPSIPASPLPSPSRSVSIAEF